MKGNNRDDLMVNDGPSSDSSTELVSPMDNGKKENRRSVHKKMERVDRRLTTESSSSRTSRTTRSNSLTPPRQASTTSAPPQKTRSKAKAMEESEPSGRESRRLTACSHSPRRSAQANYARSGSGLVNVREARPRDLSVDAATRRSRERSLDAAYRRAQQRSVSKDRSTESNSPRSTRQNAILDSIDTAIQRRAGRKPDPLSSSRHGDPSANQKLGNSVHGCRRRASGPDSMTNSTRGDAESSTAISTHKDPPQIRRSLSDDHRTPYIESLDSSSHRRPARKDPLGGSRHGPAHAQPHSSSTHSHRSHSMEPTTAESRTIATVGNPRRAAKKDDVLARSRHGDPPATLTLNASSHRRRSRSGERRKQVADNLGMVSQRRAARKDDILGGSTHEPHADSGSSNGRVASMYSQRRPNAATVYTPMTPSTTVKPNVDCFKNLSRLLSDTTFSPHKSDHHNAGDSDSQNDHDNQLMDLLTTDLTPKQLRRALRARKKVEDAKTSKQQQEQLQQEDYISDQRGTTVDHSELDNFGITLDPSTSFEHNPTSNAVDERPTNTTDPAMLMGFSVDTDTTAAKTGSSHHERTSMTSSASLPRPRQLRRHTMDHAPKYHEPELPPLPSSTQGSHFPRSTSVGALEQDEPLQSPTKATNGPPLVKRRFGKMGEGQLEAMKRDRTSRKQSVKESILSFLDE